MDKAYNKVVLVLRTDYSLPGEDEIFVDEPCLVCKEGKDIPFGSGGFCKKCDGVGRIPTEAGKTLIKFFNRYSSLLISR